MTDYERCRLQNHLYDAAKKAIHEAIEEINEELKINVDLAGKIELIQEENTYLRKEIESRNVLLKCNCSLNGSLYLELSRLKEEIKRLEEMFKKAHDKLTSIDDEECDNCGA